MIGFLKGKVKDRVGDTYLILSDCVGYRVDIGFDALKIDSEVELYIHTFVREDRLVLYGFKDKRALILFELLISISGVGPKIAIAITTADDFENVMSEIQNRNLEKYKVKGLGKKTREKLYIELENKLDIIDASEKVDYSDIKDTLTGLGYSVAEIEALDMTAFENVTNLSTKIKLALAQLAK